MHAAASRIESLVEVFVVDDQQPFVAAARAVVDATPGFRFAGAACTKADAMMSLVDQDSCADIVLMDISLGPDDGVQLTKELLARRPDLSVVLVSTIGVEDVGDLAAMGGALGYLPKNQLTPQALVYWHEVMSAKPTN